MVAGPKAVGQRQQRHHLSECPHAPMSCDECGSRVCRAELEQHQKQCSKSCPNCAVEFQSASDRQLHYRQCPIVMQCKYCSRKMAKSELEQHLTFECAQRAIKCPFYHFGCHQVLQSQHLTQHLKYNAAQHYQLKVDFALNRMEKMKLRIEALLKLSDEAHSERTALRKQNEALSLQLTELRNKLKMQQMFSHRPLQEFGQLPPADETPQKLKAPPLRSQAPDVLLLFGATKWEETGVFIRRSQLHEDRVCYTSLRTKCAIRWNRGLRAWLIDRRGLASDDEASLIAYCDVTDPSRVTAGRWLVYNDDAGQWQEAPLYRVRAFNLQEFLFAADHLFAEGVAAEYRERERADPPKKAGGGGRTASAPPPGDGAADAVATTEHHDRCKVICGDSNNGNGPPMLLLMGGAIKGLPPGLLLSDAGGDEMVAAQWR